MSLPTVSANIGATVLRGHDAGRQPAAESDLPESIEPAHAEFVVGFPCTRFGCRGTLRRDDDRVQSAVVCSLCEHVYYHVAEE